MTIYCLTVRLLRSNAALRLTMPAIWGVFTFCEVLLDFTQTQGLNRTLLTLRAVNHASHQIYLNLRHLDLAVKNLLESDAALPARSASGRAFCKRASKVAFTTLWGFDEPFDLASTSLIPALSNTARIAPPAITPVPAAAGCTEHETTPNTCLPSREERCACTEALSPSSS